MNRSQRCGQCRGCTAKPCGRCIYCQDSPQFGGPGVKKQSCIERRCLKVLENRLQRDGPSLKAKVGCNNCDECMTPSCQTCLICLDKKFFNNQYLPGAMCAKKRCNQSRALDLSYLSHHQTPSLNSGHSTTTNGHPTQTSPQDYNSQFNGQHGMDSSFSSMYQNGGLHQNGQKRMSPTNGHGDPGYAGSNGYMKSDQGGPRKKKSNGSSSTSPSSQPILVSHQPILPGPAPSSQQAHLGIQPTPVLPAMGGQSQCILATQLGGSQMGQYRVGNQSVMPSNTYHSHPMSGQSNGSHLSSNSYVPYNLPTIPMVPVNILDAPQTQSNPSNFQTGFETFPASTTSNLGSSPYFTTATVQSVKVVPDPTGKSVTAISSATVIPTISGTPQTPGQQTSPLNNNQRQYFKLGNPDSELDAHAQFDQLMKGLPDYSSSINGSDTAQEPPAKSFHSNGDNLLIPQSNFQVMSTPQMTSLGETPNPVSGLPQINTLAPSTDSTDSFSESKASYPQGGTYNSYHGGYYPIVAPMKLHHGSGQYPISEMPSSCWQQYGMASQEMDRFSSADPSALIPPSLSGSPQVVLQPL